MAARKLPFTKMHGLGNDFVVIDEVSFSERQCKGMLPRVLSTDLARWLCDRRFGVGCDQILRLVAPHDPKVAAARMEVLNADGSQAEMCGNGIRAVARYLHKYWKPETHFKIETLAGLQEVNLQGSNVRVDMGVPTVALKPEKIEFTSVEPQPHKKSLDFWEVSTGNPHAVIFVPGVQDVPLEAWGRAIEGHSRFPKRTNTEFVQIISKSHIRVRVWERGAGATLACGTGACASMVAAVQSGQVSSSCEVELPGGKLQIEWKGQGSSILMTGPADEVFFGEISL